MCECASYVCIPEYLVVRTYRPLREYKTIFIIIDQDSQKLRKENVESKNNFLLLNVLSYDHNCRKFIKQF